MFTPEKYPEEEEEIPPNSARKLIDRSQSDQDERYTKEDKEYEEVMKRMQIDLNDSKKNEEILKQKFEKIRLERKTLNQLHSALEVRKVSNQQRWKYLKAQIRRISSESRLLRTERNKKDQTSSNEFHLLYQKVIPQLEILNRDDNIRKSLNRLRQFLSNQRASQQEQCFIRFDEGFNRFRRGMKKPRRTGFILRYLRSDPFPQQHSQQMHHQRCYFATFRLFEQPVELEVLKKCGIELWDLEPDLAVLMDDCFNELSAYEGSLPSLFSHRK